MWWTKIKYGLLGVDEQTVNYVETQLSPLSILLGMETQGWAL